MLIASRAAVVAGEAMSAPIQTLTIRLKWDTPPVPSRDMHWSADRGDETPLSFGPTPWDALRAMADDLEASSMRFAGVPE